MARALSPTVSPHGAGPGPDHVRARLAAVFAAGLLLLVVLSWAAFQCTGAIAKRVDRLNWDRPPPRQGERPT